MAVIKCKMCGGDLDLIEGATTAECEYCGSVQTVPVADNEKKLTLFARANRLRAACEFDKAAGIYESIVADFPEEAEAYWGLVLCRYGIEYVDDPATGKKIPTCHRSSFESLMDDSDFEQAQENADVVARKVYREEAKQIEEIRKGIVAVSANEEPYDIFICYKETDETGGRTLDSVLAQDIYDALTDKGYRVFFSRISLEDKLGVEFEPYIFAALNSAKVMLAFGTDYEYFNAVWVKNEWSRFLKLMANDKDKHLIPCYKGIDAYDMPKEFAKLQAQDMGKVGAVQDLLRGIGKLIGKDEPEVAVVKETIVTAANANTDSLLKRAFMFLEDGAWNSADEYCEKVLDIDAECAQAYLGKLMAELQVRTQKELQNCEEPFDALNNYKKAVRFADDTLRSALEGYLAAIRKRIEEERIAEKKRKEEERIAEEKRKEKDRIAREKNILTLPPIRKKLEPVQHLLSAGGHHTVGLKFNGNMLYAFGGNGYGQCNVTSWRDVVAVSAGEYHTVGLKSDGTVVATKYIGNSDYYHGQCDVSEWRGIVAISAGEYHTVGLKSDGTVVATKYIGDYRLNKGQCNVTSWRDIVAVSAGEYHTVGLKSDGTVVAVGDNGSGQCDVSEWRDIVAISAESFHTVGLKSDGTVVAVGANKHGRPCNVSNWRDIVAVSTGSFHTVGLKSDGTVVASTMGARELWAAKIDYGQCEVHEWRDIVAVSTGSFYTVGLKTDGTVVYAGDDSVKYKYDIANWKLFGSLETLDDERRQAQLFKAAADARAAGRCQHCGGELKGLFTKKCSKCGKTKDY